MDVLRIVLPCILAHLILLKCIWIFLIISNNTYIDIKFITGSLTWFRNSLSGIKMKLEIKKLSHMNLASSNWNPISLHRWYSVSNILKLQVTLHNINCCRAFWIFGMWYGSCNWSSLCRVLENIRLLLQIWKNTNFRIQC